MSQRADGPRDRHSGARARMVARLREGGIRSEPVLCAFGAVPRHELVPEALRHQAYAERALPIGDGQTISAPGVVAAMTEALELGDRDRVLEVGTGSAYQAAVLSRLASRVISIERLPALANRARSALDQLGVHNVIVQLGDGTRGWPGEAPFDAIVVTAGGPRVPPPLVDQLAPGGRLVGPFGERGAQVLVRVRKNQRGDVDQEVLGSARFVDLVGDNGWAA